MLSNDVGGGGGSPAYQCHN